MLAEAGTLSSCLCVSEDLSACICLRDFSFTILTKATFFNEIVFFSRANTRFWSTSG